MCSPITNVLTIQCIIWLESAGQVSQADIQLPLTANCHSYVQIAWSQSKYDDGSAQH